MSASPRALISLGGLGRCLAAFMLIALAVLLGRMAGLDVGSLQRLTETKGGEASRIARRVIAYRLDPSRPTLFRFSQPVTIARILTQPVLAKGSAQPGKQLAYSIRVELLDERGAVIEAHDVHSRSLLFDSNGKRVGPVQFYRGSDNEVARADEVRITASRPFSAIRVVASRSDPELIAIDIRVGERRPLNANAADTAFARFSPEDRIRLSAPNAFPPEMLTRAERSAIAANQWRPIGPVGIDGRDYQMMILYEEDGADPANGLDEGLAETGEVGG